MPVVEGSVVAIAVLYAGKIAVEAVRSVRQKWANGRNGGDPTKLLLKQMERHEEREAERTGKMLDRMEDLSGIMTDMRGFLQGLQAGRNQRG